jgi:hypothetical protein
MKVYCKGDDHDNFSLATAAIHLQKFFRVCTLSRITSGYEPVHICEEEAVLPN